MSIYDSSEELAASLQAAGVDCTVVEDGFIMISMAHLDYDASVRVEAGWAVFKMFVGTWGEELHRFTLESLLLINERLLGFRFSADGGEIWVQEEIPVDVLNEKFEIYVFHAIDVLNTVIPPLLPFLENGIRMSSDDIDAVFGLIEATASH